MPPFADAPPGAPFLGVPGTRDLARRVPPARRPVDGAVTALFLIAIVLIGGAGLSYPLLEAVAELLSVGLIAYALSRRARVTVGGLEWALIGLAVAVPVTQVVPLPFDWWAALPGRALARDAVTAVGPAPATMAYSLAPAQTLRAALAMLPGLALFFAMRAETAAGRRTVVRALVVLAAASACLGAVQLAAGDAAPGFASAHLGQATGLFVNRNHQAALLLVALCLAPAAWRVRDARMWALIALLAAGVVATTSRTALLLLPCCLMLLVWRRPWRELAAGAATVAALVVGGWWQGSLPHSLARFGAAEVRPDFWARTIEAAHWYAPGGAGIGAFASVYPLVERRDALTPFVVNHAHNDYLELMLEAGGVAVVGFALFALWLARRGRAARVGGMAPAALGGVAVLLVYSGVDYPLRTLSLMAVFGLLCGLVGGAPTLGRSRRGLAVVLSVPLALLAARDGWARHVGAPVAVADAPLDQGAMTRWAMAGHPRAFAVAARLGWRDPAAQVMLAARLADAGDLSGSVARADAMLRQGRFDPTLLAVMRMAMADPRYVAALAAALAGDPPWRGRYLMRLDALDGAGVARHLALLRALPAVRADEAAALVARADAVGRADVARMAWRGLGDPALTRIDDSWRARRGIGGWHRTALPGLETTPLRLDRGVAGTLLYQDLWLAPGRYAMTAAVGADAAIDAETLRWSATCGDARLDQGAAWRGLGTRRALLRLAIVVPTGCARQRLALSGTGGGIGPVTLTMRLSLTPN